MSFSDRLKKFFKDYFNKKLIIQGYQSINQARKNYKKIIDINDVEIKIFSQNGEDGIIDYLLHSLAIKKPKFVEIGVGDYSESNTRFVHETRSCKGLIIDCIHEFEKKVKKNTKLWKGNLAILQKKVSPENILTVLKKTNFYKKIDLFSIDIDGLDYWVLNKMPKNFCKIAIIEFNPYFGYKHAISVPNIKNFNRKKYHYSNLCFGMSLKAAIDLMNKKNFYFIGTNLMRNNAFFIQKKLIKKISVKKIFSKNLEKFTDANFRESRNKKGELNYLNKENILKEIKNCLVVDLSTKSRQIKKILKLN